MVLSGIFTLYCAKLLLETRKKLGASSYSDLGEKTYGTAGKVAVDIALILSQSGFCCAYIFFIKESFHQIFIQCSLNLDIPTWYFAIMCFVLFTLLCYVRKIEVFASTHVFADLMIVLTLLVIIVEGCIELNSEGSRISEVDLINTNKFTDAIGFSVYSFEGIGVIMPV